jgi:hypothetical protein
MTRDARQARKPLRTTAAEVRQPAVINLIDDGHELRLAEFTRETGNPVKDLAANPVAVLVLQTQLWSRRSKHTLFSVCIKTGRRNPVNALALPGDKLAPHGPNPTDVTKVPAGNLPRAAFDGIYNPGDAFCPARRRIGSE